MGPTPNQINTVHTVTINKCLRSNLVVSPSMPRFILGLLLHGVRGKNTSFTSHFTYPVYLNSLASFIPARFRKTTEINTHTLTQDNSKLQRIDFKILCIPEITPIWCVTKTQVLHTMLMVLC